MSHRYQDPSLSPTDRLDAAVAAIRAGLIAKGMRPDHAVTLAEQARERVLVSGAGGHVRFAYPHGAPGYYPLEADPLANIVHDIYEGADAVARGAPTEAELAEMRARNNMTEAAHRDTVHQQSYGIF